jgi:hypothetical protein
MTTISTARFGLTILLLSLLTTTTCHALSFNNNNKNSKNSHHTSQQQQQHAQHALFSRRQAMALVLGTASTTLFRTNSNNDIVAHAACIAGDTSVDCIGSYKDPIPKLKRDHRQSNDGSSLAFQDIHLKQYTLRLNRDDVTITTPDTLEDAIGILTDQRLAMDDMEQLVTSGDLEQAGILLLGSMPKMTVAGRFAVWAVPSNMQGMIQPMLAQLQESATTLDKTIAMGIRGHAGILTVAQLAVLKDLSTTRLALDNLIQWAKMGQQQQAAAMMS